MYLSRLQVAQRPDVDALRELLDPENDGQRADAHHRLVWSAFAGDGAAKRDFLWRSEGQGRFLVLSAREPGDSRLFEPPQVKAFAPDLAAGDRLAFSLRANATRTRKTGTFSASGKEKKQHIDVVMDALRAVSGPRAEVRMKVAQQAGAAWIAGQGSRSGFAVDHVTVGDYAVQALPGYVGRRKGQPQYGILGMEGFLTVTDPGLFLERLAQGFGRAKAFGCGLMLIRRAA